ncbi:phospholipase effector Tle1 domain-containing protein [Acinetobacter pittii]|uniref:phospholipase effector Tle1 domain-containing protein n=1 Tax=Acinetobacter pittii TaxID=48296 RepID=UPI000B352516|nr:DUF2235 domain-containing protein [Acinetobacter pittii]
MKNLIFAISSVSLGLAISLNSFSAHAGVVDFSQCGLNSSFAIVTQSEGPTYACGGLDTGVGNPINVLNGNKFEGINDFKELPVFQGLSFSRFYNSQSHADTVLGYGWYSSFDIKLYEQPDIIQIRLETGQRINFKKNRINLGNNQFVIRAVPLNPNDGWIEKKIDGSGWLWHKTQSRQDYLFQYLGGQDTHLAHITRISAQANIDKSNPALNFTLIYDQKQRLLSVKNGNGEQLSFQHSTTRFGLPQITLTTPIGKYYYFLDRNHNLAQVLYPDGRRFKYVYDLRFQGGDIHNLTSKWQFNAQEKKFKLISEWYYDNQDRAILSQHANGVEKVSIQFDARTHKDMPANYTNNKAIFKNIVTNSLGQKTTYTYKIDGTQFQLLESLGAGCASCGEVNKRYRFNAQGLVSYTADLNDAGKAIRTVELKYNDAGELTSKTISGEAIPPQTTTFEYESYQIQQENISKLSNPLLKQLNQKDYRRLKTESRQSVVAGKQFRKNYRYNQNNQLIAIQETGFSPLGETLVQETRYGYDAQGRLSWEDGPLPNGKTNSPKDSDIIIYTYGKNDLLESWNSSFNHSKTQAQYDHVGRVIQYTKTIQVPDESPKIQVFRFQYDVIGRNIEVTLTENNQSTKGIQYHYDNLSRLQTMTDLDGNLIKTLSYDEANRIHASLDSKNGFIQYQLNNESKILYEQQLTDQMVRKTGYQYDQQGRLTTITDSKQGLLSHIDYFSDGVSGRVLNQHGDALWQRYTGDGKLQTEWDVPAVGSGLLPPSKIENLYELGRKIYIQNDGTKTIYQYDDFNRLVVLDSSVQGKTIYHYDPANRVKQTLLPTGAILSFQYDNYDRLRARSLTQLAKNGLEPVNQTTYFDYLGRRLVKVRDPLQTIEYHYNDQGQLEHRSISYKELKSPLVTYYHYDKKNNPLGLTLPDGTLLTTSKDKMSYRNPQQWAKQTLLEKQDFDDTTSGQKQLTYILGNQLRLGFEYSATGIWRGLHYARGSQKQSLNLIQSAYADEVPTLLLSQYWNFNDRHQISQVIDHGLLRDQQEFLYDSKQHVIARSNTKLEPQEMYFYDALGNRLVGENQQAKQSVQGYHYQSGRLASIQNNTQQFNLQYNPAGEPLQYTTTQGQFRFSYINGQIAKVWRGQQLVAGYQYNDAGQRIKKTIYVDQQQKPVKHPQISYYFYNGTQLAGELNAKGHITRQYIYTGDRLLAIIDYAGHGHTPNPLPLTLWQRFTALFTGQEPEAKWYYVVNDYMGRPRMVTDQQQRIVWQDQGKALFGESDIISQGYQLNIRYAGQYADIETGLYYNGYRYYDSATGRYTTPDPLGLAGGKNLYGYVNQQPNQYFDPQGLLLFAFDGTGNTDTNKYPSNVEKFMDAYASKGQIDVTQTLWKNQEKRFTSNADASLNPNHDNVFYIAGAGTEDQYTEIGSDSTALNALDNATGGSLPNRVDQMLVYFSDYVHRLIDEQNKKGTQVTAQVIDIDTIGFSRGAASARLFASKLEWLTSNMINPNDPKALLKPAYQSFGVKSVLWDKDLKCKMEAAKISLNFRFMGVWDTVPALGLDPNDDMNQYNSLGMTVKISERFKNVAHAVAVNDHREGFMVRSIYANPSEVSTKDNKPYKVTVGAKSQTNTRIERGFMGAHSDIGGGYSDGDLSNVSLMWMIDQAKKAGIQFSDPLINKRRYNVVTDPIVHDSTGNKVTGDGRGGIVGPYFDPGRDFAWANDNNYSNRINQHLTGMSATELAQYTKDYANPSAEAPSGVQVSHLGLNWKDTLQFQNAQLIKDSTGKFEQFLKLEQQFTTDADCKSKEVLGGCKALTEYQELKSNDKTGSATIVYRSNREDEAIQITNYLNWIKANYGTALTFKAANGVKAK